MKFPTHIVLDLNNSISFESLKHWSLRHLFLTHKNSSKKNILIYLVKKNSKMNMENELNLKKIKYSNPLKQGINVNHKNFNFDLKIKHKNLKNKNLFNKKNYKNVYSDFFKNNVLLKTKTNNLWNLFDIHFIKKEKLYTKLKYSRVPQYDIVSGGVAALFAGFLGFLICEKFGFELLDSGDFYIAFMYAVFFSFFSKLFLKLFSKKQQKSVFSLIWAYNFYKYLLFNFYKNLKKKIK